jgi:hypothetical protein
MGQALGWVAKGLDRETRPKGWRTGANCDPCARFRARFCQRVQSVPQHHRGKMIEELTLLTKRRGFLAVLGTALVSLLSRDKQVEATSTLSRQTHRSPAGTWVMTSFRPGGVEATVLVVITADGTFLRVGDAHPVESPGVGAWVQVREQEFDVSYMALPFDADRQFVRSRKAALHLTMNESFDELSGSTATGNLLQGRRFRVEPIA